MSSKQHARGLGPPADRLALYHVPCGTAHRDRHRQTLRTPPTLRSFVDVTSYTRTRRHGSCGIIAPFPPPSHAPFGGQSGRQAHLGTIVYWI
jgi:hypothetical protein